MKLFTVFVSFAPPPRDVIVVIIPYKEEAEQMKLFTFLFHLLRLSHLFLNFLSVLFHLLRLSRLFLHT